MSSLRVGLLFALLTGVALASVTLTDEEFDRVQAILKKVEQQRNAGSGGNGGNNATAPAAAPTGIKYKPTEGYQLRKVDYSDACVLVLGDCPKNAIAHKVYSAEAPIARARRAIVGRELQACCPTYEPIPKKEEQPPAAEPKKSDGGDEDKEEQTQDSE